MAETWISGHHGDWLTKTNATFAIVDNINNELLGAISLTDLKATEVNLGYWIGEPHWGSGYCTEATSAILNFAHNGLGLNKVVAKHLASNPASGRVMKNNGMHHVASIKKPDRNGALAQIEIYEISLLKHFSR